MNNLKNFLTPGFFKSNLGIGSRLILAKGAICIKSWSMPATITPQAKTYIGISYIGAMKIAAIIKDKLKTTGVNAGIENF